MGGGGVIRDPILGHESLGVQGFVCAEPSIRNRLNVEYLGTLITYAMCNENEESEICLRSRE